MLRKVLVLSIKYFFIQENINVGARYISFYSIRHKRAIVVSISKPAWFISLKGYSFFEYATIHRFRDKMRSNWDTIQDFMLYETLKIWKRATPLMKSWLRACRHRGVSSINAYEWANLIFIVFWIKSSINLLADYNHRLMLKN